MAMQTIALACLLRPISFYERLAKGGLSKAGTVTESTVITEDLESSDAKFHQTSTGVQHYDIYILV